MRICIRPRVRRLLPSSGRHPCPSLTMSNPTPLQHSVFAADLPGRSGLDLRPIQPSRLFYNATRHDADEQALQVWWQTFDDAVLDRFVEACLNQNAELSLAGLRVAKACAGLTG